MSSSSDLPAGRFELIDSGDEYQRLHISFEKCSILTVLENEFKDTFSIKCNMIVLWNLCVCHESQ